MPPLVLAAVMFMFAALVCYTIGVWSAALSKRLRAWHAGMFWLGFAADSTGTDIMRRMAGGLHWGFHTATGAVALLLMLGHAVWATTVLVRRQEAQLRTFHRLSVVVWCIWLVPFVTGLVMGARRAG
jgi:uncharacterized repeat protein (TIGR03987 family)